MLGSKKNYISLCIVSINAYLQMIFIIMLPDRHEMILLMVSFMTNCEMYNKFLFFQTYSTFPN